MKNESWELCQLNNFTVIDILTSGFDPNKGAAIVEIAALKIQKNKVVDSFITFVNPSRTLSKKVLRDLNLLEGDFENTKTIGFVMQKLYRFIEDDPLVFHDSFFQWEKFLKDAFFAAGKPISNRYVYSTLDTLKDLKPEFKSYGMKNLISLLGLTPEPTKRAFSNVYTTLEIITILQKEFRTILEYQPLKRELAFSETFHNYEVLRVSYWTKDVCKRYTHHRLYVITTIGEVYYDQINDCWYRKDMLGLIDFYLLEQKVLNYLHFSKREELKEFRGIKARTLEECNRYNLFLEESHLVS